MEATSAGEDLAARFPSEDILAVLMQSLKELDEWFERFADADQMQSLKALLMWVDEPGTGELDSGSVSSLREGMTYDTRSLLGEPYSKFISSVEDVNISGVRQELLRPSGLSDLPEGLVVHDILSLRPSNLSDLPEELVVDDILSRLTVKDAAATSIFSKAWEKYWTYSPILSFVFFRCDYSSLNPGMKMKERKKYAYWVTDAIKKCNRPKLKRFHIFFDLDSSFQIDIDDWVTFSLEHKVQALILELVRPFDPHRNNYSFPKRIKGDFLHVLVLENVDLDDEDFQNISHFKALRELSVTGSRSLEHIKMVDSSVRVKSLVVRNCWNIQDIEICDVQLENFQYAGRPLIRLDLNRVPSLLKVSLCEEDMESLRDVFKKLGCCLSQLRTLALDNSLNFLFQLEENVVFPIPQLPELEHLELQISADDANVLLQLASFLNASPRLQKLSLKVEFLETPVKLFKAESLPHKS